MRSGHDTCTTHAKYLLSCESYEELLDRAGDRCEVCSIHRDDAATGKLFIDHEHERGFAAVRGLACPGCNFILGQVDAGKPAPAHLAEQIERYLANPWVRNVPVEVGAVKRDELGELVIGNEVSTVELRAQMSDILHASAVRNRITFVTKGRRQVAAVVPLAALEAVLAD